MSTGHEQVRPPWGRFGVRRPLPRDHLYANRGFAVGPHLSRPPTGRVRV